MAAPIRGPGGERLDRLVIEGEAGQQEVIRPLGRESSGRPDQEGVRPEQLVHIDLAGRVPGRLGEEAPVCPIQQAPQADLLAEEAVVKGHLGGHHRGQVMVSHTVGVEHLLLVAIDQLGGRLPAALPYRVRCH